MNATIKRIGGNEFEVSTPDGLLVVLVSYSTPVAVRNAEGKVARTKVRFSRSTEQHIRDFERRHNYQTVGAWDQTNLDQLLVELTGSSRLVAKQSTAKKLGREHNTKMSAEQYDAHTEQGDKNLVVPVYRRSYR